MEKPLSILVVEDVDEMRMLLEHVLQEVPEFQIAGLARNCSEARLVLSRNRPDLVLLDEVLPGEASYDFLKEIIPLGIPVLLMTSMESPPQHLPDGVLGRITKPGWKSVEQDRKRIKNTVFLRLGRSQA